MNARSVLCFSIFFCLVLTNPCLAGLYQKTKDGKAFIWNNHPMVGDAAEWSGDKDANGYATGHGTLTWFTTEKSFVTGSNIPAAKRVVSDRYTGTMVRGKFEGPVVSVDAKGRTTHGTYVDGSKSKDWALGPLPKAGSKPEEPAPSSAPAEVAAIQKPNETPAVATAKADTSARSAAIPDKTLEPPPPAEGPRSPASVKPPKPNETQSHDPGVEAPNEFDDSLRSLVGPPSGLRPSPSPQSSAPPSPVTAVSASPAPPAPSAAPSHLNAAQVLEISDAEARAHGYSLGDFQHPQAQYNAASDSWSVLYDRKSVDGNGMAIIGQKFSVTVEDKTKKTSLAPEK